VGAVPRAQRRVLLRRPAPGTQIEKVILWVVACLLFGAVSLFAQGEQIFKGEIARCKCAQSGSRAAVPGEDRRDAPCTVACQDKGAMYVLYDAADKVTYQLDNQNLPRAFAAREVLVVGSLDKATSTIHVNHLIGALIPKVNQAKSVYIDCDGCVRGMAKARLAAFEELTVWKRFTVVPDPHKADLIFLLSANPYLGDYLTRDGPDKRLVRVGITYMNVVDPKTGENLWGDSEKRGSWFVADATKDLIAEFREQLEQDQNPAERQLFLERYQTPQAKPNTGK
jgi:hypothetical protein